MVILYTQADRTTDSRMVAIRASVVFLLTLHSLTAYIDAAQLDAIILVACRQRCAGSSLPVAFDKCMDDCFQVSDDVAGENIDVSEDRMSPETQSEIELQQHRLISSRPQPEDASHDDRKRLSLSPRAASLVGSGMAHQYLRIGRSQTARSSRLESDAGGSAAEAAGSRYPIERRNANSLTGSRLGGMAKSYLRVGKKEAETPEAPRV